MLSTTRKSFFLLILTAFLLTFLSPVHAGEKPVDEVRNLLESYYVDPVPEKVLEKEAIEDMLKALGAPNTKYLSSEQYEKFISSLDKQEFDGIGIYIETISQGVLVLSVIKDSPAEDKGLKAGDIIIKAAEKNMAGLTSEEALSILRGPAGSEIKLTVKREGEIIKLTVTRNSIKIPTVTGEMVDNNTAYIDINTFGSSTSDKLGEIINRHDNTANGWIFDLRSNSGGYLHTACSIAGYFINHVPVVGIEEKNNSYSINAAEQEISIDEPAIFLINEYSASASEVLSAAVKDYDEALLIGNNTFGKGTVQRIYKLSDGGILKLTVARFYSPHGGTINKKGVSPHFAIDEVNSRKTAELLLSHRPGDKGNYVKFEYNGETYQIDLDLSRTPEYWKAYRDLMEKTEKISSLRIITENVQKKITASDIEKIYPLFYPSYTLVNQMDELPTDKVFTISFPYKVNWETVNNKSIELVNINTGKRIPLNFTPQNKKEARITLEKEMTPSSVYWLLIHPTIEWTNSTKPKKGYIAEVNTVEENK